MFAITVGKYFPTKRIYLFSPVPKIGFSIPPYSCLNQHTTDLFAECNNNKEIFYGYFMEQN